MVDALDRKGGVHDRIQYLKDNDIVYEVTSEDDEEKQYHFRDHTTSTQFHMRNFIDNKYMLRINSNANVYPCYIGNPIGNVNDMTLELSNKHKSSYCDDCTGLKGYTKILSQWDRFDFNSVHPKRDRFSADIKYNVFKDMVGYIPIIDNDDSLSQLRSYKVKL
jgi:hypothetical protein